LTSHKIYFIITLSLVMLFTAASPAAAQKRRKGEDDSPKGIKLREAEFYFTEGEKYFILEDYAKALIYYQRALESNPENGTIHFKVAEVFAKSNKPEDLVKATLSIEQAIELDPTNKFFYLTAASIYTSQARFDKAAEAYENLIRAVKGSDEYLYELAAVYQYGNRTDDAIKTYNRAEAIFGVNDISSVQKMRLHLESGNTKEGIAEGEKLLKAFPDEEKYVMAFAEVLSQKGMRQEAISYLENFISTHPEALDAAVLVAGLYRDNGEEQKARPILGALFDNPSVEVDSKVIILGAYNAELVNARNKGLRDPEKEAFAISLFEKLNATNPDHPSVHVIGGDLFLAAGKNREAEKEYRLAAESGEVNFEVWENLLYLQIQLEQFDAAAKYAEQALEMFPNHGMIHYFNGFAMLRKRMYQESVYSFEQAKKLSQANPSLLAEINSLLGEGYYGTKEYSKSDKAFDEALAANPNNNTVLNNYSFYLAVRKENLDKAEKMSTLLVRNNPDNPTYLDTHAWVLYVRQKFKDARKVIEKAISTGKANASHFEHYGDILYKLGEVDSAVAQWEKARGLNAKSETLNKKIANRKIYE
jgi:tetratricopeptide (TPR) repeat protein